MLLYLYVEAEARVSSHHQRRNILQPPSSPLVKVESPSPSKQLDGLFACFKRRSHDCRSVSLPQGQSCGGWLNPVLPNRLRRSIAVHIKVALKLSNTHVTQIVMRGAATGKTGTCAISMGWVWPSF